jgi:hypothetical protein
MSVLSVAALVTSVAGAGLPLATTSASAAIFPQSEAPSHLVALPDAPAVGPFPIDTPSASATEPTVLAHGRTRNFLMEVNFRGRYLSLPSGLLNPWYFNADDVPGHPERPSVKAWSAGLEWVIKNEQANGIFYAEYAGFVIDEGYWDDREDPPITTDGDYIVPDGLGLVDLGANYAYELHTGQPWLSFLFGGGLGVGFVTGQLVDWKPGQLATNDPDCQLGDGSLASPITATSYERNEAGCGDDGPLDLPMSVWPMVDVNVGVRFTFSDRANLRLEGGLHDLFYVGMAAGVVF